jgi:galactose mutarotase-like enzyme
MTEHAIVTELESVPGSDASQRQIRTFSISLGSTQVHVCSFGASVLKFLVKGDHDIVLGYKDAAAMLNTGNPVYFSPIVGRVANRIGKGKFTLDGTTHTLELENNNNGPNHLHGGGQSGGFSHLSWNAQVIDSGVQFTLVSPDGDQGYPGTVQVTATYTLKTTTSDTKQEVLLRLEMKAKLLDDKPTPINLAQHSYFNLSTRQDDGILDHFLTVESDYYTPVDETSIPTREVRSLNQDAVMDWQVSDRTLRDGLIAFGVEKMGLSKEQAAQNLQVRKPLAHPYGFDHNYVVRKEGEPGEQEQQLAQVATLCHEHRTLTVYSTAPGVQVYTANYLGDGENDSVCKGNYGPWQGICLETQHFPDSIGDDLKDAKDAFAAGKCFILRPGGPDYEHIMEYHYSEEEEEEDDDFDDNDDDDDDAVQYIGSDTQGNKYTSIQEMWQCQDLSTWYDRASDWYEGNCSTTVDGVLGGLGFVSDVDLKGSQDFVKNLKLPPKSTTTPSVACECGAGIGRVTKGLLLDFCDRCDLVESSERLLYASPEYIGGDASKCRFYCFGLQEWEPTAAKYTIVWIQWVLCYLTDEDIVKFLQRCKASLVEGGVIIMKENTCANEMFVLDVEDASVTRSLQYWLDLISKAGLQVVKQTYQDDFPDDIFPVPMLALQPKA